MYNRTILHINIQHFQQIYFREYMLRWFMRFPNINFSYKYLKKWTNRASEAALHASLPPAFSVMF